jgi:ABC-2 type transport system permease protein
MYYLKVWWFTVKRSLSKGMIYRVDVLTRVFRAFIILGIQMILVESLYASGNQIAGWEIQEFYLLVGIYDLINYFGWGIFTVNFWRLETKIIKGEFDFALLRPTGSVFAASVPEFFIDDLMPAISGFILVGYYLIFYWERVTLVGLVGGFVAIIAGIIIWYSIQLFVASFNFLSPKNGMLELLKSFTLVGAYPPEIFSKPVRVIFHTVFPIALIAALPARVISGVWSWEFVAYSVVVALISLVVAISTWRIMLKRYTSSGG